MADITGSFCPLLVMDFWPRMALVGSSKRFDNINNIDAENSNKK